MHTHYCPGLRQQLRTWELYTIKDSKGTWTLLDDFPLKTQVKINFYSNVPFTPIITANFFMTLFDTKPIIYLVFFFNVSYWLFFYSHLLTKITYYFRCTCLLIPQYHLWNALLDIPEGKIWKYLFNVFWSCTRKWAGIAQLGIRLSAANFLNVLGLILPAKYRFRTFLVKCSFLYSLNISFVIGMLVA